jgi:hypothetical protein
VQYRLGAVSVVAPSDAAFGCGHSRRKSFVPVSAIKQTVTAR